MTVIEVVRRSAEFLAKKDVDSPRLQVELLLAHVLRLPRMGLYLNFERELSPAELDQVRELVRRRGQREPLQHILGTACFCGLELAVGPSVLIPRPETEELAEMGWKFLSSIPSPTALDFGTGSGCLAIALAVKSPAARICAVDISPEALAAAQANAERHKVQDRIQFHLGDGYAPVPTGTQFDLIIANPPYIPSAEIDTLQPEVRDYDPRLALDGGVAGLDFYERLAAQTAAFLRPAGRAMLEFGADQASKITSLFKSQKWVVENVKADYSGRQRFLIAHQPVNI